MPARMPVSKKQEYRCETCLKTFRDKSDFGRHINRKTPCSAPETSSPETTRLTDSKAESCKSEIGEEQTPDEPNETLAPAEAVGPNQGCVSPKECKCQQPDKASSNLDLGCHEQIANVSASNITLQDTGASPSGEKDTITISSEQEAVKVSEPCPTESGPEQTRPTLKSKAPRKKVQPEDVLPLGSENLDHLTSMKYPRLKKLIECKPEPSTIIRMVQAVHLDKKVLQNFNVRIVNDTLATIFQRNSATRKCSWVQMAKDAAVEKLVTNGIIHFYNIAHVLEENMKPAAYDELMEYLNQIDTAQNDKEADEDINLDIDAIAVGVTAALSKRCT